MEPNNDENSLPIIFDQLKEYLDFKILKRKRTPVVYIDCDQIGCSALTALPTTTDTPDHDSDAEIVNGGDPDFELPPAPANGDDDPHVGIQLAPANVDDTHGGIQLAPANGDDPHGGIQPAQANGDDPRGGIQMALANGDDPRGEGGELMPAEMREHVIGRMGGYRVQMIIEKVLTATDMRTDQGRVVLPPMQLKVQFLTPAEEEYLERRDDSELNYMETMIVGPDLRESPIRFKKWLLGSRFAGSLMNKWNCFAKTYGLKAGNKVRIWSFRVDRRDEENDVVNSELRFALVKL